MWPLDGHFVASKHSPRKTSRENRRHHARSSLARWGGTGRLLLGDKHGFGAFKWCHQGWPHSIRTRAQRPCLQGPRARLLPHLLREVAALAMWLVQYLLYSRWSATVAVAPRNVTLLLGSWPQPGTRLIKEFVWFPEFKGLSEGCCLDFKILVKISGKMEDLTRGLFLKVRADCCYVHMTPVIIATNNW